MPPGGPDLGGYTENLAARAGKGKLARAVRRGRRTMDCPRCNRLLERRRVDETEVEVCPGCAGMFLERGELNRVAGPTEGDLEFSTLHGESFEHEDRFGRVVCPSCRQGLMKKVEFVIHTSIILDYCERCRGFWLDGPEVERVHDEVRRLDESRGDEDPPPMIWFARFIWGLPR